MTPAGPQLSPREARCSSLLAEGFGVAAIARRLFVSESTAKTHISKIYEKLGAANRAQAIMKGIQSVSSRPTWPPPRRPSAADRKDSPSAACRRRRLSRRGRRTCPHEQVAKYAAERP